MTFNTKWKAGYPTSNLSAEELIARGYVKVSNAYGLVSRIDRPDWIEFLAQHYGRAPADFCKIVDGRLVPSPNWGAHYLQFSKDTHTVKYETMRQMPSSTSGAIYVPLPEDESKSQFIDIIRPMTPGELHCWNTLNKWPCCGGSEYMRGPTGGASVNIECPQCGMRLNVPDSAYGFADSASQVIRVKRDYTPPVDPPQDPSFLARATSWLRKFLSSEVR